ncbi:hypothetical protein D3C73_807820 [compost metagenome]
MVGQIGQPNLPAPRQRMVPMGDHADRVGRDHPAVQVLVIHQKGRRGNLDAVVVQRLQHRLRIPDGDRQVDARVTLVVPAHRVHDVEGAGRANAQIAFAQVAGVAQAEIDLGFLLHQLFHHGHQALSCIRQAHAAALPVEQFDAVARFQLTQLPRHGRLADTQLGGGLGDGAAAGHGVEGFEFGDKHDEGAGKGRNAQDRQYTKII